MYFIIPKLTVLTTGLHKELSTNKCIYINRVNGIATKSKAEVT